MIIIQPAFPLACLFPMWLCDYPGVTRPRVQGVLYDPDYLHLSCPLELVHETLLARSGLLPPVQGDAY
jgi:hypothetical protein